MEDKRCCGRGVCIINDEGVCWCGQRWDGEKMLSANSGTEKTKELDKKELPNKQPLNNQNLTIYISFKYWSESQGVDVNKLLKKSKDSYLI